MSIQDLIEYGYFISELPYCFSAKKFSLYTVTTLGTASSYKNEKEFEVIKFSVPTGNKRRVLGIPHPIPYLLLSEAIANNWSCIETHFTKSPWSFSQTNCTNIRDRKHWGNDFRNFKDTCILISSTRLWELKVDIQSFYTSIYTHSIAWAIHGKDYIKGLLGSKDRALYRLVGHQIDNCIQRVQKKETKGIPIGSENFRIVAEMISSAIDFEFNEKLGEAGIDVKGARYLDDGHFFFHSRADAEKALRILEKVMSQYHLELHPDKTRVIERPCSFEDKWILALESFNFSGDLAKQKDEIKIYANLLITLAIENPKKSVVKKGFGKLWKIKPIPENKSIFESLLYRIILCSPIAIKQLAQLISDFESQDYDFDRERLNEFLLSLLEQGIEKESQFEINWALFLLNKYQLSVDVTLGQKIVTQNDPLSIIQVLDMNEQGLINGLLYLEHLTNRLDSRSLTSALWILAYEAEVRNWLSIQNIEDNIFFKQLKAKGVRFYKTFDRVANVLPKTTNKIDDGMDGY